MKTYHEMDAVQLQELLRKNAEHVDCAHVRWKSRRQGAALGRRSCAVAIHILFTATLARPCSLRGGYKAWLHVDGVN